MSWIYVLKLPNVVCEEIVAGKTQLVYKGEGFSTLYQDLFGTRDLAVGEFSHLHTDF